MLLLLAVGVIVTPESLDEEPLVTWWAEAREAADALLRRDGPPEGHRDLAQALKRLAFVATVAGEARYADRAREWFALVRPGDYATGSPRNGVLGDSSAARDLAIAHDLVGGPVDALREIAERMERYDPGWYRLHRNNWQIRQFSAVGMLAIALGDEAMRDRATGRVREALDEQICADGAFAEGHAYLAYSADLYVPFAHALRNTGGEDLFAWEPLAQAHRWSVLSRLPDGRRPNFDDAHLGWFPSHAVPDPWMRWDWEQSGRRRGFDPVESIAYFTPVEPQAPDVGPSLVFRAGGDVIFRTGWEPDASMLILRAEAGEARRNSRGHEHADNLSFIYVARGRMTLIDSGYINWEQRGRVARPENHNVILIDGRGPSLGDDVEILETGENLVRLRTSYAGATIERTVIWEEGDFTLEDTIDAPQAERVTYLFHELEPARIEFDREMEWEETEVEHSFDHGVAETHRVRRASGPPGAYRVTVRPP